MKTNKYFDKNDKKIKVGSEVLAKVYDDVGKIIDIRSKVVSLKKYEDKVVIQYQGLTKFSKEVEVV